MLPMGAPKLQLQTSGSSPSFPSEAGSNTLQGDYSSQYSVPSYNPDKAAKESSWLGEFLYGTNDRDLRDFALGEQSASNQLVRDMQLLNEQNVFNHNEAQLSREFTASETEKQREYDKYMASHAYQLAMQDMKSAGLNPILAYQQGGAVYHGASSVSGATASSGSGSAGFGQSHRASSSLGAVVQVISGIMNLVAGLYGIKANAALSAAKIASAERVAAARDNTLFNIAKMSRRR